MRLVLNLNQKNIRNFCIIAHIDHGKSTLADRILEITNSIEKRSAKEQILDNMDLERERGITIKARAVRLDYIAKNGQSYILNLIDTPGHVDFTYEVSRSLAACEGAILVVDASQGIEAQTLANTYLAIENNLEIVPVINKIDLQSARPEEIRKEIEEIIGIDASEAVLISAKNGIGIIEVLEAIVNYIPSPKGKMSEIFRALIFDSYFDEYKGVVVYVRVFDGELSNDDLIKFMSNQKIFNVLEVGHLGINDFKITQNLKTGEVGYIVAGIKNVKDVNVGDTITLSESGSTEALPGYKEVKPMVFCGVYPQDGAKYDDFRVAFEKLQLNDASLSFEVESSVALGFGFRCGFLGLLHMEIIQERLEREYNLDLITTAPSVIYKVIKTNGEILEVDNPANLPLHQEIKHIEEPIIKASIMSPKDFVGAIMGLCQERRGIYENMTYLDRTRVLIVYYLPLNEIIYDFFDALKSKTHGFASFEYEFKEYRKSDLVKLDILLNGEIVDALSFILHKEKACERGRKITEKLKGLIPRQLFEVPIQAAIEGKIIARETVKAVRKDVTSKCYGGDITRKKKLLEKQKEGKKRMRQVGSVEIPQDAFMAVLKLDQE
ncbi:MAG: translation elongation factor 4 [Clostridiales bacterium]|nr:translation elongation factor 4 [Clostridiales bacterium]